MPADHFLGAYFRPQIGDAIANVGQHRLGRYFAERLIEENRPKRTLVERHTIKPHFSEPLKEPFR